MLEELESEGPVDTIPVDEARLSKTAQAALQGAGGELELLAERARGRLAAIGGELREHEDIEGLHGRNSVCHILAQVNSAQVRERKSGDVAQMDRRS